MVEWIRYVREEQYRQDQTGVEEYIRSYLAKLTDNRFAAEQIQFARPDLARFQPHPDYAAARVRELEIQQRKHSLIFDVRITYSTAFEFSADPLSRPAVIREQSAKLQQAITRDADGRPIINTAGDLILDLNRNVPLLVFEIQKNVSSAPLWFKTYPDSINSDALIVDGLPCDPGTLVMDEFSLSERIEGEHSVPYRVLRFHLVYADAGWDEVVLNRGVHEISLVGVNPYNREGVSDPLVAVRVKVPNVSKDGQPLQQPAFLDLEGRRPRLKEGLREPSYLADVRRLIEGGATNFREDIKDPLDLSDIITLRFNTHVRLPFGGLPLR
jgi:hypothetical protein